MNVDCILLFCQVNIIVTDLIILKLLTTVLFKRIFNAQNGITGKILKLKYETMALI